MEVFFSRIISFGKRQPQFATVDPRCQVLLLFPRADHQHFSSRKLQLLLNRFKNISNSLFISHFFFFSSRMFKKIMPTHQVGHPAEGWTRKGEAQTSEMLMLEGFRQVGPIPSLGGSCTSQARADRVSRPTGPCTTAAPVTEASLHIAAVSPSGMSLIKTARSQSSQKHPQPKQADNTHSTLCLWRPCLARRRFCLDAFGAPG